MNIPVLGTLAALAGLSALIVRAMIGRGVLDVPGARSSHQHPTPKGGGVGIAAAFALGLAAAWGDDLVPGQGTQVAALEAGALLIAGVSWADDVVQFGFRIKLAAQVAACVVLVAGGLTIDRIGPLPLGVFGAPVTFCWLLFAINAVNFIDGLNGLASGSTMIAAITIAIVSLHGRDPFPAACLLPLAAGIAGFLPFNYPRARIFMGDVGSQLCGLVLAAMAGPSSRLADHSWGALLVPMAMAPILADVAFTLLRRGLAGARLTEAHRGHLYQLAHRSGWPAAQVTPAFWALTLTCAVLATYASRGPWAIALLGTFAAAIPVVGCGLLVIRAAKRAPLGRW